MLSAVLLELPQVDEIIDEATARPTTDPALLAEATTSLGSYCLRWELILRARVRRVGATS